jgi:hypothetical protein
MHVMSRWLPLVVVVCSCGLVGSQVRTAVPPRRCCADAAATRLAGHPEADCTGWPISCACRLQVGRNVIHGSDSVESATREIGLWFPEVRPR